MACIFLASSILGDVKFLRDNANKRESEYTPDELTKINALINTKREKILAASLQEVKSLSAELNGFISFYGDGADLNDARQNMNMHYLIHTDTYQESFSETCIIYI